MRWKITGADKHTGEDRILIIEAAEQEEALAVAKSKDLFTSSIQSYQNTSLKRPNVLRSPFLLIAFLSSFILLLIAILSISLVKNSVTVKTQSQIIPKQFYDLHIAVNARDDKGDLIPLDKAAIYLLLVKDQVTTEAWLDEYRSALTGKLDVISAAMAKVIAAKFDIIKIDNEITSASQNVVRTNRKAIDSSLFNEPTAPSAVSTFLDASSRFQALQLNKTKLEEEQNQLTQNCTLLGNELNQLHIARFSELGSRLSSICLVSGTSMNDGSSILTGIERGNYLICVIPSKEYWYWYRPIVINENARAFFGPDQQIEIGTKLSQ